MKTLKEVLQAADPIDEEGPWTDRDRDRTRQAVVRAARQHGASVPRRSIFRLVAAALVVLATAGAGASLWPSGTVDVIAAVRFEIRLAEDTPGAGLREAPVGDSKRTVFLHEDVVLSNGDVAKAEALPNREGNTYSLVVTFTPDGARKMEAATRRHSGRPLAVLLDGRVVTCPVVRGVISSSAVVDAHYPKADADRIVAGILGR